MTKPIQTQAADNGLRYVAKTPGSPFAGNARTKASVVASGRVIVIRPTPSKPSMGLPCNGCGFCCAAEPCRLAVELLACATGPCIALEHEGGRTFCALVRRPAHYLVGEDAPAPGFSALFAGLLRLGGGCDAEDGL